MQAKFPCPVSSAVTGRCEFVPRSSFALLRHLTNDHEMPRARAEVMVLEAVAAKQAAEVFEVHPDYLEG